MATRKDVYQVEHPYTGETMFLEKGGKLYAWATFCRFPSNPLMVEHLGWSNADTAEAALASARRSYPHGTDYGVAPAKLTTAGHRDAHLARAERAKAKAETRRRWFDAIVTRATEYVMTDRTDEAVIAEAKRQLSNTVDYAIADLGVVASTAHTDHRQRVMAAAETVGRWFKVVADDLAKSEAKIGFDPDREGKAYTLPELLRAEDRIERKVSRYLAERDALMGRLEAIPPA